MPESTEKVEEQKEKLTSESVESPVEPVPKARSRVKKVNDLPVVERRNWLLHQHFVRKEFDACKKLIKEQLTETGGECEYALYVQAMISRSEGRIAESTELLQACAKLSPKSSENLKQIARNLFLVGKYKNSIECYKRAAEFSAKDDWEISHQLGVCFLHLKEYGMAEDAFNEALQQNKHDITFSTLSRLYLETNRMDKAVEVLKKGIEFASENLDLLTTLGLLYLRMGDFHKAFQLLGDAMSYDPENYKAILATGSMMQIHGDFDVALTKYRVAAQKAPESAALWNNIAMCFFGKKKYVAAISCLKRATYLSPFDWRILYNLCLLHVTMQQYASAFQFGSTALRMKPKNADIYFLLAVALNHLGETENAKKSYEEALQLKPDDIYITLNYAMFLNQMKEAKQALRLLKKIEGPLRDMDSDPNADKEVLESAKKLGAALHIGDKFLQRTSEENSKPSSKDRRKKSTKHVESESVNAVDSSLGEKSSTTTLSTPGFLSPALSSPISPVSPVGALPPLKARQDLPSIKKNKLDRLPDVPQHSPEKLTTSKKVTQPLT